LPNEWFAGSGRRQALAATLIPAAIRTRYFSQLAFERSRAGKQAAVDAVKIVVRRKEHEAAGNAHGDADGAPVELNCETLGWH
jgi:hypothetical protein